MRTRPSKPEPMALNINRMAAEPAVCCLAEARGVGDCAAGKGGRLIEGNLIVRVRLVPRVYCGAHIEKLLYCGSVSASQDSPRNDLMGQGVGRPWIWGLAGA